ncbi:MAG: type II toxin-antitoxin system PemK/MazF family toxin [Algoriphagus sp.]|uniref:type II toxin-antitoxin system PemK/MazF family toxin n=1 Tax=Algoriphagus sp. TaxID=1872435 RepID=UPI002732095C|nr:type II toxin-antitoxin system PemK/MazF family toxin [Algoriphagus sp.]MDP2041719.1 type II toxin-antitoxin system PemK/MazF family toxin [Algoriphagus sp.]MDP3473622.1 type II toxin-antitoxin system PemK/MazF family toxin [Algoriphagus sp.]
MTTKKNEIWLANLDPRFGTEAGKTRPVLIIQSDLLNKFHPSSLICPITTNVKPESKILRVQLKKGVAGVNEDCDVMIDQIRAIDNKRLLKRIGSLLNELSQKVKENLKIVLDLED